MRINILGVRFTETLLSICKQVSPSNPVVKVSVEFTSSYLCIVLVDLYEDFEVSMYVLMLETVQGEDVPSRERLR